MVGLGPVLRGVLLIEISLFRRLCDQGSQWTLLITLGGRPVKTIPFTFAAGDTLGKLPGCVAHGRTSIVLVLSIDKRIHHGHGIQFVSTDTAVDQLLPAPGRVEIPASVAFDQRYGERPFVFANAHDHAAVGLPVQDRPQIGVFDEFPPRLLVGHLVSRVQETRGIRPEDRDETFHVVDPEGLEKGIDGRRRRPELRPFRVVRQCG